MSHSRPKTAIVPVAGLGTRLLPITQAVPKELLPLGGFPTLHYVAAELAQVGIERIILVSSESKSGITRYFTQDAALTERLRQSGKTEILGTLWSESEHANVSFEIVIQHEQLGLGHAILCAADAVPGEPIVVALGDCVMGLHGRSRVLSEMVNAYETEQADIVIAFETVPDEKVSRYGIASPSDPAQISGVFSLADVVEKPALADAPSNLAIAARYILAPEIFDALRQVQPGKDGEIQLTDALRSMISNGARAYGVRLPDQDRRFDVGNLESYTEAFIQFALDDPKLRPLALAAFEGFQERGER